MKHAKFFSLFVILAVLSYGAVIFYYLPLASFEGELTRTGILPEKLFGWTKPQPVIDAKWMQQASMHEADVLVIGDSFSASQVWQTVLTRRGLKVRTEYGIGMRSVCSDFVPWLKTQGFTGKFLIIESIERNLMQNLSESIDCHHLQYHQSYNNYVPSPPIVSFDVNQNRYNGKASISIRAQLNSLKYNRLSQDLNFTNWMLPNNVRMTRVQNGCELFSHTRCNDVLFLDIDRAEEVDESALKLIEKLNSRLNGITPIWVVVPNKSTAYFYPEKQFWNKAEQQIHSPNLLRMTQRAIKNKVVDLYPANNTHFSTTGYLLMGEEIFQTMEHSQYVVGPVNIWINPSELITK
jgi:hypothetical protein